MWTDDYIGIPFLPDGRDRDGLDCYGLVCLVYRDRLGVDLPGIRGIYSRNTAGCLKRVARAMAEEKLKWRKVEVPAPYDVVMLRTGEYAWHVGLVIDKRRMLHVLEGTDTMIDEYAGLEWRHRIEGFYRYAG